MIDSASSQQPPIFVTQPHLPPLEDLFPLLQQIWESRVLTNNGPLHQQLEIALCNYLGVSNISLFCNGTIALITALNALRITGEVITTPYSFVATSHALLWNNLKPVFVDIEPNTFNIDPYKIESAITERTTAILPMHCYGVPCNVDAIESIAKNYNLKVIYDAAHAFGVNCHCGSILNHGDLSVLSFHATKVFNTLEGGAIVCHDNDIKKEIDRLKNFGFSNETEISAMGINGKMNEIQAAIGLLQLESIDRAIDERSVIAKKYRSHIKSIRGLHCVPLPSSLRYNHAYFPILVDKDYPLSRDELYQKLKHNSIFARRYFHPLISDFDIYYDSLSTTNDFFPVASSVSQRILCLPIYPSLDDNSLNKIISLL